MARLTKKKIDALNPNSPKTTLWDDNPKGLGVRVSKGGDKTFFIKYRTQYGQQRKLTLGRFGVLTLEQARSIAKERLYNQHNHQIATKPKAWLALAKFF